MRIFVSNIIDSKVDHNIVKTMIQLAHALGYTVVAEGVEHRIYCQFNQ
ncbi:EAL domain-containing protein (plasmid) [Vibrio campbellii]|uniref:EAL domain-containing protein n=1 Tax=Vibrio campbellii TaxID=680 RepID=A0ABY5IMS0_9VIBR|nr:EAL domain-containing protein [Vibrio campbellii]